MAIGLYGVVFTAQDLHGFKSIEIAYIIITDVSGVMVALGAIIFMVSFAGCVGALRENLCLLKLYFWSLTLFLIAELMFAIACIIFPWKSREILESILSTRLIENYRDSENTQNLVDFLQKEGIMTGMPTITLTVRKPVQALRDVVYLLRAASLIIGEWSELQSLNSGVDGNDIKMTDISVDTDLNTINEKIILVRLTLK
ncbi:Tetraspanin-33 [Halocaridina rubra]|uniref:Tetraspanin-33 n=1 Tax=Halocaridina rubra TaxID=373956 RepID=A0AAN9A343_HALRR